MVRAAKSVAGFAIGGFELVHLRIALTGEFTLCRLAIKIGPWAVIQGRMQIDPYLGFGIAAVCWSFGGFGQPNPDQEFVKRGKIRVRGCRLASIRGPGDRHPAAAGTDRMIGPDSPANHDHDKNDGDREIEISATGS